ncbi:hypothetical protein H9L17_09085 [Thermomonas brevis]|uniref:Lipoprotein n=1 Tax=Thermomonas brevis TaxID=215691 RepID=A0A7G9QPW1_9GAMM|nr:hypothetical protein [Thermomonas brevis]QNN45386.1 hypothetical protein H9L17_09085 [Thermomonas brevis]
MRRKTPLLSLAASLCLLVACSAPSPPDPEQPPKPKAAASTVAAANAYKNAARDAVDATRTQAAEQARAANEAAR